MLLARLPSPRQTAAHRERLVLVPKDREQPTSGRGYESQAASIGLDRSARMGTRRPDNRSREDRSTRSRGSVNQDQVRLTESMFSDHLRTRRAAIRRWLGSRVAETRCLGGGPPLRRTCGSVRRCSCWELHRCNSHRMLIASPRRRPWSVTAHSLLGCDESRCRKRGMRVPDAVS